MTNLGRPRPRGLALLLAAVALGLACTLFAWYRVGGGRLKASANGNLVGRAVGRRYDPLSARRLGGGATTTAAAATTTTAAAAAATAPDVPVKAPLPFLRLREYQNIRGFLRDEATPGQVRRVFDLVETLRRKPSQRATPAGILMCADENQWCKIPPLSKLPSSCMRPGIPDEEGNKTANVVQVLYGELLDGGGGGSVGVDDKTNVQLLVDVDGTKHLHCTNAVFGRDPSPGKPKYCGFDCTGAAKATSVGASTGGSGSSSTNAAPTRRRDHLLGGWDGVGTESDELREVAECPSPSLPKTQRSGLEDKSPRVLQLMRLPSPCDDPVAQAPKNESSPLPAESPAESSAERLYRDALRPLCAAEQFRAGIEEIYLDCRFTAAYDHFVVGSGDSRSTNNAKVAGEGAHGSWIGSINRAWVTFFGGRPDGPHAKMITNLVRSVHLFSAHPVIVFSVDSPSLPAEWDPGLFPHLIVVHAETIEASMSTSDVSFNFNKLRSMLLRIKVGVQLDADQIVASAHADKLFDATEREIHSGYPYPIMPVHWMSRLRGADRYGDYHIDYPGDELEAAVAKEGLRAAPRQTRGKVARAGTSFPPRQRWAHAHPTWTYHALPFIADTLLARLDQAHWFLLPRTRNGPLGKYGKPERTPEQFMHEDEDMLNVLLWRHEARKMWCKFDLEPDLFAELYDKGHPPSNYMYDDAKWFKDGVPLVFLTMHNAKDASRIDRDLGRLMRRPPSAAYIVYRGKLWQDKEELSKDMNAHPAPCILV